jgi:hypothetical protein
MMSSAKKNLDLSQIVNVARMPGGRSNQRGKRTNPNSNFQRSFGITDDLYVPSQALLSSNKGDINA